MNEHRVRGIWVLRWRQVIALGLAAMLALVTVSSTLAADAETPPARKLLRPDSLVGWQYGPTPPSGWTIERGVLRGDQKASQLNSAWTFGDFDLALTWTASADGAWEIVLPLLASGGQPAANAESAVRVLLKGKREIEILAPGATAAGSFAANGDSLIKTTIRRHGKKLTVQVGQAASVEISVDPHARLGLALKLSSGSGSLQEVMLSEPAGEPIFNGRDLTGWWTPGNLASWKVEKEQIVCLNNGGNYLRTEKEFGNFTLSLDYKMNQRVNSGVGIRTPHNGWPSSDGIEVQLEDKPGLDKHATMALYGNLEPLGRADKSQAWNHLVVKAEGRIITGWMNGELVQHADASTLAELKHRHLAGWIGLQDHGGRIRVRNMRVLEAPLGDNPMSRRSEPPVPMLAERVLDRLMNCQRLAQDESLRSGVVQGKSGDNANANSSERETLAELTGPGAVVSLWQANPGGTLAFYFDGESQPRFNCAAADLAQHVPRIGEDASPLLTFAPFAKSLKIVGTSGPAGEYRIEYVTLPADASTTTTASVSLDAPRGLLSAIDYRYHQLGGGTHREADPYERLAAPPRTIEPGASSELLRVDGAGTTLWFKLIVDPKVLETDYLWLDVRVDGERQPAISAPARFWYPALAGGANHDNLTQVHRGGFTSLLAMPFDKGLSVAARNVGKSPIAEVGAATSVERNCPAPMRLRGVFNSGNGDKDVFSIQGRGRWVALVSSAQPSPTAQFGTLEIDGQSAPGWNDTTAAQFWGPAVGASDVFRSLSGHSRGLSWRYLLLAPVEFSKSIVFKAPATDISGNSLALFYLEPRE